MRKELKTMKNTLKIDFNGKKIVMDRTFAKNCTNTNSDEYAQLQSVRRDYPDFTVVTKTIKRNPEKETYKGLTYEYMEDYILRLESEENALAIIKEFNELRTISKCHKQGLRYPTIKRWFLEKYPEIVDFAKIA